MKNIFAKVTSLFQSVPMAVANANRMENEYAIQTGSQGSYVPFGIEEPQKIAVNLPGIYAADTSANIIAALRNEEGKVTEKGYYEALNDLANLNLSELEKYIAKNLANLGWRSGQPFRDISTNPLSRITRSINMQFNQLPSDEQEKDIYHIRTGAAILLEACEH